MKKAVLAVVAIAMLVGQLFLCNAPVAQGATTISDLELATYWAPVWYQDTDSTDCAADYINKFRF